VRNDGNADGKIAQIAATGSGFVLADLPFFPATLAPGASLVFRVLFAPTDAGQYTGQLKVGNDTFTLRGLATASGLPYSYVTSGAPIRVLSGGTVTFNPAGVGASTQISFSINNTGSAPGLISSITLEGSSNRAFSLSGVPALPITLQPSST